MLTNKLIKLQTPACKCGEGEMFFVLRKYINGKRIDVYYCSHCSSTESVEF